MAKLMSAEAAQKAAARSAALHLAKRARDAKRKERAAAKRIKQALKEVPRYLKDIAAGIEKKTQEAPNPNYRSWDHDTEWMNPHRYVHSFNATPEGYAIREACRTKLEKMGYKLGVKYSAGYEGGCDEQGTPASYELIIYW